MCFCVCQLILLDTQNKTNHGLIILQSIARYSVLLHHSLMYEILDNYISHPGLLRSNIKLVDHRHPGHSSCIIVIWIQCHSRHDISPIHVTATNSHWLLFGFATHVLTWMSDTKKNTIGSTRWHCLPLQFSWFNVLRRGGKLLVKSYFRYCGGLPGHCWTEVQLVAPQLSHSHSLRNAETMFNIMEYGYCLDSVMLDGYCYDHAKWRIKRFFFCDPKSYWTNWRYFYKSDLRFEKKIRADVNQLDCWGLMKSGTSNDLTIGW